jgi:hypothetical protein
MHQAKIFHGHWLERKKLWFNKPVSIYNRGIKPKDVTAINILNLCGEPRQSRASNKKILDIVEYYGLVLSWDEELLNKCDNIRFMPFGTTWIDKKDWGLNQPKKFKITTLCGAKNNTLNHQKRHVLWNKQKKIEVPHVFWNSSHAKLPDKKNNPILEGKPNNKIKMMNNSQFHIAIENVCSKDYFSEKLIDCLITGTIPIYCGCTNLEDYFDTRGIIQVNEVDDIIKKCNSLTPSFYKDRKDYILVNYHLAHEYANSFSSRLHSIIQEYIMYGKF